jgi:hypothetical protein
VTFQDDGTATVRLRRKKTDTETRVYPLGADAVDAVHRWLAAAQITAGPLFRPIGKASKERDGAVKDKAIGVRDVTRAVKRLAGDEYSAHSLRVGMALIPPTELGPLFRHADYSVN